MPKPSKKDIQRVTAYLGSLGGKAVSGAAKRNATTLTPETAKALAAARAPEAMKRNVDYAALARKAAKARKRNRKAAAG